jgi:hypothetical protein
VRPKTYFETKSGASCSKGCEPLVQRIKDQGVSRFTKQKTLYRRQAVNIVVQYSKYSTQQITNTIQRFTVVTAVNCLYKSDRRQFLLHDSELSEHYVCSAKNCDRIPHNEA